MSPDFILMFFFSYRIHWRIPHLIYLLCLFTFLQPVAIPKFFFVFLSNNLKSNGQLFCRISFNVDVSDVFLWLDCVYVFLGRILQMWCTQVRGHMRWIYLMSVNVNLNHFGKVVSDEFLHYKVTLIPFVFKNLGGDTWEVCKYSVSPQIFVHLLYYSLVALAFYNY